MDGPSAWAEAYARATRTLRRQLTSDRSLTLYETLVTHAADAATGGVVFFMGATAAQAVQKAARIGAATPVLPRIIGLTAVASSSVIALHFASLPRELFEDRARLTPSVLQRIVNTRVDDLQDAPIPVYMVMGLLCFKLLGGHSTSLSPSHYAQLGAFHLKKASLPATAEYATQVERGVIQEFGRLFGCHTCGIKRGVRYHADHMPPKLVAQHQDASIWRRMTGRKTVFRFYPQCEPCSNQQGTVVKQWKSTLKTHFRSVRPYHMTGLWLVLFCTGGLYVGGSDFHAVSNVQSAPKHSFEEDKGEHKVAHQSQGDLYLTTLRERERILRRQKKTAKDKQEINAITAEIDGIVQCKKAHKQTVKQQQAGQ